MAHPHSRKSSPCVGQLRGSPVRMRSSSVNPPFPPRPSFSGCPKVGSTDLLSPAYAVRQLLLLLLLPPLSVPESGRGKSPVRVLRMSIGSVAAVAAALAAAAAEEEDAEQCSRARASPTASFHHASHRIQGHSSQGSEDRGKRGAPEALHRGRASRDTVTLRHAPPQNTFTENSRCKMGAEDSGWMASHSQDPLGTLAASCPPPTRRSTAVKASRACETSSPALASVLGSTKTSRNSCLHAWPRAAAGPALPLPATAPQRDPQMGPASAAFAAAAAAAAASAAAAAATAAAAAAAASSGVGPLPFPFAAAGGGEAVDAAAAAVAAASAPASEPPLPPASAARCASTLERIPAASSPGSERTSTRSKGPRAGAPGRLEQSGWPRASKMPAQATPEEASRAPSAGHAGSAADEFKQPPSMEPSTHTGNWARGSRRQAGAPGSEGAEAGLGCSCSRRRWGGGGSTAAGATTAAAVDLSAAPPMDFTDLALDARLAMMAFF